MSIRLLDAYPGRAVTKPGETVALHLEIENRGSKTAGLLMAELRDSLQVVSKEALEVEVEPGRSCLKVELIAPMIDARGYEALLRLQVGRSTHTAGTAVLVASHWRIAPRYGFLSHFTPGLPTSERAKELGKFHLTVVQFYDWMYRHYRFLPPEDVFEDAMGRKLSLQSVRDSIEACRSHGMAALAYGAVYGPEPEFIDHHPDWVLRDAAGTKLSLIDLFYLTDLRPQAPWREHILREYECAVRDMSFDGIHMDQYGFPKWSYDLDGKAVDLAEQFPGLIDEAARLVSEHDPSAAVLFNAVNNWPVERIARTDQAAVYIEVWRPHEQYRDLVELVRRGRDLSGKQVVLAAYLSPFKEGGEGAEHSALLATAVIASAGGFHLLLGEGDGVLHDPYYVNHGRLRPEFLPTMRRYYDHTAANHHYLFGDFQDVTSSFLAGINEEILLVGAPVQAYPRPGCLWASVKQSGSRFVINLVNLVGQQDDLWDAPKREPETLVGLTLRFSRHFDVQQVTWSSPDERGPARELPLRLDLGLHAIVLPDLKYWATLVVEVRA